MFLAANALAGFNAKLFRHSQRTAPVQLISRSGTAPTVLKQPRLNQTTLLKQGESAALQPGDLICLLCTRPDVAVEVMGAPEDTKHNPGGAGVDEPSRKRARTDPSTACVQQHPAAATDSHCAGTLEQPTSKDGTGLSSLMLMLVGLPGSGKSTLSKSLVRQGLVPWVHVNQDTVGKGGKPGTRQMCLKQVRAALASGKNCVLDRSNLTVEQREEFLQLCKELRVAVHALVLNLKPAQCSQRVVDREDHPGGVQGTGARGVVFRMNHDFVRAGVPTLNEGFSSIRICNTLEEVQASLDAWSSYGPAQPEPPSSLGLDRVPWAPPPRAAKGGAAAEAKAGGQQAPKGGSIKDMFSKARKASGTAATAGAAAAAAGAATACIVPAAASATPKSKAPQTLQDSSLASTPKAAPGTQATTPAITPAATAAKSPATLTTDVAARRVAATGGGVDAAASMGTSVPMSGAVSGNQTDKAGTSTRADDQVQGPALSSSAMQEHLPADAPSTCSRSLTDTSKVPTMQEKAQPTGDMARGGTKVGTSGTGAAVAEGRVQGGEGSKEGGSGASKKGGNAFAFMMKAARTGSQPDASGGHVASPAAAGKASGKFPAAGGGWQGQLKDIATHPERHTSSIPEMHVDSQYVRIPDKYPKARHHLLFLARDPQLDSVHDLRAQHIPLLEHLKTAAQLYISEVQVKDPSATFQLGFHSIPSMQQLHLHLVSTDFDSPSLKNKKHWNSFTTSFFLKLDQVLKELQEHGVIKVDRAAAEALLKQDLHCHRCGAVLKTIPALKAHIMSCSAPTPSE